MHTASIPDACPRSGEVTQVEGQSDS